MQYALVSSQKSKPGAQSNAHSTPQRSAAQHGMSNHRFLQRKCACGASAQSTGECTECKPKREGPRVQLKALAINKPGDPFEQEADRVAEQVMRMPEPRGRSKWLSGNPEQATAPAHVQAKSAYAHGGGKIVVPPIVHEVLGSPGQPLDAATRAFMEPRFGHDFSTVRVHTDARAAQSAAAVNARAYTVGRDVVFAAGAFAPQSVSGRHLLSHELTHALQQSSQSHSKYLQRTVQKNTCEPASAKSVPAENSDNVSAWEVGWDWLTVKHPSDRHFGWGDRMTIDLMRHEGIVDARAAAVSAINTSCSKNLNSKEIADAEGIKYSLGGIGGVWKYLKDASTLATLGTTGNLTVAFTGSYNGCWEATMNCCSGTAQVRFHVKNTTGLTSGTRLPILGYDGVKRPSLGALLASPIETAKKYGPTLPGSLLGEISTGPMANAIQYFDWKEQVFFTPPQQCNSQNQRAGSVNIGKPKHESNAQTFRTSAASVSWIDPASPAGFFVSDPEPAARTTASFLTGGADFRFSNFLESWINSSDAVHIGSSGIDAGSGIYRGLSFMGIPSVAYPVLRAQSRISRAGIEGVEYKQTVGAQTVSSAVIGGAVSATFGAGRAPGAMAANLLTNFPPIWTTIRLQHFADGTSSSQRVRCSYFPSNVFYSNLGPTGGSGPYKALKREQTIWGLVGWGAGNPWAVADPSRIIRRRLTAAEKAYAAQIYYGSVELEKIVITRNSVAATLSATTVGNTINLQTSDFAGDFGGNTMKLSPSGLETLIHEMGHVWQFQHGGMDYAPKALYANAEAALKYGDRNKAYDWVSAAKAHIAWEDWNPEQQAECISDFNKSLRRLEAGKPKSANKGGYGDDAIVSIALNYMPKVWRGEGAPGEFAKHLLTAASKNPILHGKEHPAYKIFRAFLANVVGAGFSGYIVFTQSGIVSKITGPSILGGELSFDAQDNTIVLSDMKKAPEVRTAKKQLSALLNATKDKKTIIGETFDNFGPMKQMIRGRNLGTEPKGKYVESFATDVIGDNPTRALLGSFDLNYNVIRIHEQKKYAEVHFTVSNNLTLSSMTRLPPKDGNYGRSLLKDKPGQSIYMTVSFTEKVYFGHAD